MRQVKVADSRDGFGPDERHISGEHQHGVVGGERLATLHQGVSGAKLLALLDEADVVAGNRLAHALGLMPNDAVDITGVDDGRGGADHVSEQRQTANRVQHLGLPGLQARALARSQDGDGKTCIGRGSRRGFFCAQRARGGIAWVLLLLHKIAVARMGYSQTNRNIACGQLLGAGNYFTFAPCVAAENSINWPAMRTELCLATTSSSRYSPRMGSTPSSRILIQIADDWFSLFRRIRHFQRRGNRGGVQQGIVEHLPLGVLKENADVVRCSHAEALIGLSHEIADVSLDSLGSGDCLRNALHEQIGNKAGEKRSGPMVMRSASASARRVWGSGRTLAGTSLMRTMRPGWR